MAALTQWKPMKDLFDIHNQMTRVFDDLFGRTFDRPEGADEDRTWGWTPAVDVLEADDHYEIRAEIPGVAEKDVHVSVADHVLTIKGEKKHEKEKKDRNYHRVERSYGSFSRSFSLPENLDSDKVKANFKNGILTVSVPKSETAKPKAIPISTN